MKLERRNVTMPIENRRTEGGEASRKIEGYALVFNSESLDLGGFRERIDPAALDGVLERSDVLALFNHNPERGILARSRNGEGTLTLTVDEKGLRYSFEAPNTTLGEEVLEGVRRGDITGSSFAFTVEDEQWEKEADGRYLRTIKRFAELFDVSPVIHPAYEATSVDTRGLDEFRALEKEKEERSADRKEEEQEEDPDKEECKEEGEDEPKEGEDPDAEGTQEEKEPEDEKEKENDKRDNNLTTYKTMEKKQFSLLGAIRSIMQNKQLDETAQELTNMGRRSIELNGIADASGQILIPLALRDEKRYEETPNGIVASQNEEAAGYGGEAVPTELFDVLGPLMDRMVLGELGARMLTLTGNVEIPLYTGATATWEGETAKAKNGAGKFSTVKMSPKRITAFIPVSRQFLFQSTPGAEALIRENLIAAVSDKLQSTIFGSGAGSNTEPAGLFKGVNAESAELTYADIVGMEEALETAKVFGEKKYVLSPQAKALLRTTKIDAGSGRFVMENGEVLGTTALSTGSVVSKGMILGDWSNFYLASFGALDITVDPYTLADQAQIRLVVNAWFDYAAVRPEAFVKKILK